MRCPAVLFSVVAIILVVSSVPSWSQTTGLPATHNGLLSPNGRHVALQLATTVIEITDLQTGQHGLISYVEGADPLETVKRERATSGSIWAGSSMSPVDRIGLRWSPSGAYLALIRGREVKVFALATFKPVATFNHPVVADDAYWSPDSRYLLFGSGLVVDAGTSPTFGLQYKAGVGDWYLGDASTSTATAIGRFRAEYSPNGAYIATWRRSGQEEGCVDLVVIPAAGGAPVVIDARLKYAGCGSTSPGYRPAFSPDFAWLPDSSGLVCHTCNLAPAGTDGHEQWRLGEFTLDGKKRALSALRPAPLTETRVSVDGQWVYFMVGGRTEGPVTGILTDRRVLWEHTVGVNRVTGATWDAYGFLMSLSPDAKWMAFWLHLPPPANDPVAEPGTSGLCKLDGTGFTRYPCYRDPEWSPDGQFYVDKSGDTKGVRVISPYWQEVMRWDRAAPPSPLKSANRNPLAQGQKSPGDYRPLVMAKVPLKQEMPPLPSQ